MRRPAAVLMAIAAALNAAPAAAAPPHWQPVAKLGGIFDVAGRSHGEGHLAFIVTIQKVDSSPSPIALPTPSPSPGPKPAPHSPAAIVALIVTLAVLGAGALAVVRARWGSPGSGSAPPSP